MREQDARTRCTKSSAGAQAIFFKSIFQETREFFLGSVAGGLSAPGADISRCSRVKPLRMSQLALKPPSSPSRMPLSISHLQVVTPEMSFKLIFLRKRWENAHRGQVR